MRSSSRTFLAITLMLLCAQSALAQKSPKESAMITIGIHEQITAASQYSMFVLSTAPGETNPYEVWQTNDAGLSTPVQSPNVICQIYPGRMYQYWTGSNSWHTADVQFNIPPGYTLYLGSLGVPMNPRTSFITQDYAGGNGTWQESFYVLPTDGAKWLAPGYSAGPRVGDINWSISAGQLASGILAGSLNWRATSITSALLSAKSLTFSSSASTINLNSSNGWSSYFTSGPMQSYIYPTSIPDQVAIYTAADGSPKFIGTNQIEIYISEVTGGFYVNFYQPGTPILLPNNDPTQVWGFYNNFTASYFVSSPDSPFTSRVQIARTDNESGLVETWILGQSGSTTTLTQTSSLRVITMTSTPVGGGRTETYTVADNTGHIALNKTRNYQTFPWGEELVSEVADPAGLALTTTYTYYNTFQGDGHYSKLQSVTKPDGSWVLYNYSDDFAHWGELATVSTPWQDAPTAYTAATSTNCKFTTLSYAPQIYNGYQYPSGPFTSVFQSLSAGSQTAINGTVSAQTTITPSVSLSTTYSSPLFNYEPMRADTIQNFSASGVSQTTVRTVFHNTSDPVYCGKLYSQVNPDGTKMSASYWKGTANLSSGVGYWNSWAFTPNSTSGIWVSNYLSGTSTQQDPTAFLYSNDGTTGGMAIDPVWMTPYKSFRRQTITDAYGNPAGDVNEVFTGSGFQIISWHLTGYSSDGFLVTDQDNSGSLTTYTYKDGQVSAQINPDGTQVQNTFDALMRVTTAEQMPVGASGSYPAQGAINTNYTYDGASHVLSTSSVSAGGGVTLSTGSSYNLAGLPVSQTDTTFLVTNLSYSNGARTVTTTFPNGSTKIADRHLDGAPKSVTGNAQVNQFASSVVNSDGTIITTTYLGSSGSSRSSTAQTDWLGRMISQTQPAFGAGTFTKQSVYNTMGQLTKATQTGMSATLYQYDGLGRLQYTALDVNNNGSIDFNGTDRISETTSAIYMDANNVWWNRTQKSVFNVAGSSTPDPNPLTAIGFSEVRQKLVPYASTSTDYTNGVKVTETDSYDIFGNLTAEVLNCNRVMQITTDTKTLPNSSVPAVKVSYYGLLESSQTPQDILTTYQYDGLNREVSEVDPRKGMSYTAYFSSTTSNNGQVSSRTDAGGNATSFTYDSTDGRLFSQTDPMGNTVYHAYDHVGREIKTWGTGSYPVEYAFDAYGSQIAMRTFRSASINFNGNTWPLSDDGSDPQNPSPSSWANGDTTSWTFDGPTGLLTSKMDASAKSVSYTYTPNGKLATRTWATGVTTNYSYDPNTAEQIGISYSDGTPGLTYTFDRLGHGSSVVQAYSGFSLTTGLSYNVPGKLTQETFDPTYFSGRQLTFQLDTTDTGTLGRTIGYEMGTSSIPGLDQAAAFGYDADGRLNSVGLSNGPTFSYAFASNSNLIGSVSDSADNWSQSRTWDPHRDLLDTIQTTAGGGTAPFVYTGSPQSWTVPAGVTSLQVLVVAGGGGGGTGGGGGGGVLYNSAYSVTPLTNISVTVGGGGAAGGGSGSLDGANGANSIFGTLTAIGGGGGGGISTTAPLGGSGGGSRGSGGFLTYGGAGTSGEGTAGGNSTNDSPPYPGGGGGGSTAAGGNNVGTSSGAGGNGYSSSISGSSATYGGGGGGAGYGTIAQGGIGGAGGSGGGGAGTFTGAGGGAGTPGTGGGGGGGGPYPAPGGAGGSGIVIAHWGPSPAGSFSYVYDALGRRTSKLETGTLFARYPAGGVVDAYAYDARSEVIGDQAYQSNNPSSLTTPVLGRNFVYAYDPIGNRTTSSVDTLQTTYTSNALNQITSRVVPGSYAVSGLAPSGATITLNGTAIPSGQIDGQYYLQNVTANNSSAPLWLTANLSSSMGGSLMANAFLPQTPESSAYDADGNLLTDGRWNYFWDAENRLKAIETYGNQTGNSRGVWNSGVPLIHIDFKYDYMGRRISKMVSNWNGSAFAEASETRYAYEQWNLVADYSVSGGTLSLAHSYVWGIDLSGRRHGAGGAGGLLAMVTASGSIEIPIHDANGNIHGLTDRITGQLTAAYEYSPFGELLRVIGPYAQVNPFLFSSKYTDIETGHVYYGHRYYNPLLGRFLGRDPKMEKGGLHLYGFVGNNAINRWDYLGMTGSDPFFTGLPGADYNPPSGPLAFGNGLTSLQQQNLAQTAYYNAKFGRYNSGMGPGGGLVGTIPGADDVVYASSPGQEFNPILNNLGIGSVYQMNSAGQWGYGTTNGGDFSPIVDQPSSDTVQAGHVIIGDVRSLGEVAPLPGDTPGGPTDTPTQQGTAGDPSYLTPEQQKAIAAQVYHNPYSQISLGDIAGYLKRSGLGSDLVSGANAVDAAAKAAAFTVATTYGLPIAGGAIMAGGTAVGRSIIGQLAATGLRIGSNALVTDAVEASTIEVISYTAEGGYEYYTAARLSAYQAELWQAAAARSAPAAGVVP